MLPEKINAGDEIRVIAPARSASDIDRLCSRGRRQH